MRDWSTWVPLHVAALVLAAIGCSGSDDAGPLPTDGNGGANADGGAGKAHDSSAGSPAGGAAASTGGNNDAGGRSGMGGAGGGSGAMASGGMAGKAGSTGSGGAPDGSSPSACLQEISAMGLAYVETEARGVVDAVELTAPLNGVLIANGTNTDPASDPVACEFVKRLWDFAELLKARGFNRVGTLGSYCYRCCCAYSSTNFCRGPGDPEPDCSADGYSNHSWGRAVDIRYYFKADGTRYDIDDPAHWVRWTATGDTCVEALPAQTGVSRELYELVCEASAQRLFSTILTPNYNAAHRNHTHLDIGESDPASAFFIRSLGLPYADIAEGGDE